MSSTAMQTAVTGLLNQQTYMDVISNNISNSDTYGYKKERITFEESFYQLLQGSSRPPGDQGGVNPLQVGTGTSVSSIDNIMEQGTIESTGNETDVAIQGDGFFVVSEGNKYYYTRAGSFQWDSNGTLVLSSSGMKVQGRIADAEGKVDDGSSIEDIIVEYGTVDPAKATTEVSFVGNLNSEEDPVGNVLETARLYSREIAGSTTNVNGLYASGDADLQITGMSSFFNYGNGFGYGCYSG